MKSSSCAGRQRGTLIEFSLAAVLLLPVGLGIIETAHWFAVRQTVSLALMQAARTGAVMHAQPEKIEQAFERGLLPLFGCGSGSASNTLSLGPDPGHSGCSALAHPDRQPASAGVQRF